jgi:protein O-mannosyl-transferase
MTRRSLVPVVVAALTTVCFLPALAGSFLNWDDNVNFLENPAYRGLGREQIHWAFTSVLFGHYIPLTRLSWSLNYVTGGLDPRGYHLLNLLLHAANTTLFYVVARRLLAAASNEGSQDGRDAPELAAAAAVAALVFGVHPLRVEPVVWISARPDLLCAMFLLVATWAYLHAVEGSGPARRGPLLVSVAALAAALLSKGAAVPLVAALLLLDVYPLRRPVRMGWAALLREKVPHLLVTLVGAGIIVHAVRQGAVLTGAADYGAGARLTVAAYSFLVTLVRFVWPAALSPLYEMPARVSVLEPRFGLAMGATVLVTVLLIVLRRRWPAGLATWAFSALMLAPMSAAVRRGVDLAPDRYTYLAGMGFALLVGGAVLAGTRLVRRGALSHRVARAATIAGVVTVVGLGATSWSLSEIWGESETLWRWAIEVDPACSTCHGKLGESALAGSASISRAGEAEGLFRRAIALRPDLPEPHSNLGTALVLQGRYAEAEAPLRDYMERVPQAVAGPERLGLVYLLESRYEAAIPLLRSALIRRPDAPGLREYLVQALQGRARELEAQGRGADAEPLRAESRALGGPDTAAPPIHPGPAPARRP